MAHKQLIYLSDYSIFIAGMMIFRLKKVRFFDFLFVVIVGYALFQFGICMGRRQYQRVDFGDSYNRMQLGMIPLMIFNILPITVIGTIMAAITTVIPHFVFI